MKPRKLMIGPGVASLLLVLLVLTMGALSLLALRTAGSDLGLSRRSVQVAQEIAQLNDAAESELARLDALLHGCAAQAADDAGYLACVQAALPEGVQLSGRELRFTVTLYGRSLQRTVRLQPWGVYPAYIRTAHQLNAVTEEMGLNEGWN